MNEISLSPSTTEIMAINGSSTRLKGRDEASNYPQSVSGTPVFGGVKPDYEKLKLAQPDLVVYDASLYSPADVAKLEQTVGKDKLFAFHAANIEEFENQLREFGALIATPLDMSKYVDKIEGERKVAQSNSPAKAPTVAVLNGTYAAGTKGFIADVVNTAGGKIVGSDSDRFTPMNPEAILQANPDMIILAIDLGADGTVKAKAMAKMQSAADQFSADPRFRSLKAVATGQIYPLDADIVLRQGARVDLLINFISKRVQLAGQKKS